MLRAESVFFQWNDRSPYFIFFVSTWPKWELWWRGPRQQSGCIIIKILKLDPKQRLPLEEMIKHPFITKFTPDAPKRLIKPVEGIKYEPFIVSKFDPKTWVPKEIK